MPTFIKTGFWESAVKSYKGWLNLEDLISGITISGSGTAGQLAFWTNTSVQSGSSSLFWDNAGKNLGIGTSIPTGKLDIVSDGGGQMIFTRYGGQPQINIRRSQGTFAAPVAVTSGASSLFNFQNYNGTGFATSAQIQVVPTTQTPTDAGGTMALNVVRSGTTTMTNGLLVSGNNATPGSISISTGFNGPNTRLTIWGSTIVPTLDYFDIVTSGGGQLLRLFNTGNLVVGNSADSGEKLQVIGNAKITGSLDLFSVTSAGGGSDYFYVDNDPNISAGVNNQTISLMRLRDRGSNGAFTGVNRLGIVMENTAGGQFPFQLFSNGGVKIGYNTVVSTTTSLSLKGGTNDNTVRTLDIENAAGNPVLRVYNGIQVLVGSSTPAASTILQADSTTQGFLPPRMTTAQKNAIVTPPAGLVVYDTGLNKLCVFTTGWQTITSA